MAEETGARRGADALPRLTLYTRAGCHLCEDMQSALEELFGPGSFALDRVDIDADPALRARYDTEVPVLLDGELELCRHFLDPVAVRERLASYNPDRHPVGG